MKMIRHSLLALLALLGLGVRPGTAAEDSGRVAYRCDEVVVIGRVRTIQSTDVTGPGDLPGSSRYDMRVSIKRVLRGKEARRLVPAHGVSHGQMREDVDFWLVLTPAPQGGYVIRTGNLAGGPFRLAPRCG
jgi:hypothetical protein